MGREREAARCALEAARQEAERRAAEAGAEAELLLQGARAEAERRLREVRAACTAEAEQQTEQQVSAAQARAAELAGPSKPSSDSSQFPSTCSSLPRVFGRSNVAC